jgi:hypothetical protein
MWTPQAKVLIIFAASLIVLILLTGAFHVSRVSAGEYDPCPPGTGPGGITAGDYPPTSLTQEQRQWLFEAFGHTGIASVGYGGERCGQTPPTNTPYVAPTNTPEQAQPPSSPTNTPVPAYPTLRPCPGGTGPGGITAGDYDPTKLSQEQRQWLFEAFGHTGIASVGYGGERCGSGGSSLPPCPAGSGPDGITAGNYDPTKLTQPQRQWLFEIFGNSGTASVGYGGQGCSNGIPYTPGGTDSSNNSSIPSCPSGTGPEGITAGNYDPTKLTQPQRQWLFEIFGHIGTASVGYGGENCSGGTLYTPGTDGGATTIACPSGTGPDGITAGSYDPTKLTQDQRNWLYVSFGHQGIAPVGYGGEVCTGGFPYTPGESSNSGGINPVEGNSGGVSNGENPDGSSGNVIPVDGQGTNSNEPNTQTNNSLQLPDISAPFEEVSNNAGYIPPTGNPYENIVQGLLAGITAGSNIVQYWNYGGPEHLYDASFDIAIGGLGLATGLLALGATAPFLPFTAPAWAIYLSTIGVAVLPEIKKLIIK